MRTLLIAAIVGVFLFAGSAAVSWYLMNQQQQLAEVTDDEKELDELDPANEIPPVVEKVKKEEEMPVGLRPDLPITVESVMEMSRSIRKKEQELIARENQIKKDEEGVKLLFGDLEREQKELTGFSSQVDKKITTLRELVEELRVENEKLASVKKTIEENQEAKSEAKVSTISPELQSRVDTATRYFSAMEPDIVAKLLRDSADSGDIEFAALVFQKLDERKGGKVLAELNDSKLIDQLLKATRQ